MRTAARVAKPGARPPTTCHAPAMRTPAGSATEAVLGLHRLLAEDTPLDVVRQLAVVRVGELTGGAAALWLDEDDELSMVAFSHADPAVQQEMFALTGGLVHGPHSFVRAVGALEQATSLTGAEVLASLPLMEPAYARFFGRHPVSAMLLQPLRVAGQRLGLLGISRDEGTYDAADTELVTHIGYVLSVVLHSVRLQEQQRAAVRAAQELQAAQARLAATDDLTSLLNRRGFAQRCPAGTDRLDTAVGVLVLDLDDFKAVNDGFGHPAGDALLLGVAAVLERALPPDAVLARTGGDEFTVLLAAPTTAAVRDLLRSLGDLAPDTQHVLGVEVPLHVSAGLVVVGPGEPFDAARAVQHADAAMYRAKRSARTDAAVRVVEYDRDLDAPALGRLTEAARFRRGLRDGELLLHYQRSVAARPGDRATGHEHVEALVRWSRDGEVLAPGAFLPLVKEIGALAELTDVVLDLAVGQLSAWYAAGRSVTVAVNVPAHLLLRPGLLDGVLDRLQRAGLPPRALSLEVTETELVQSTGRDAVVRAREAGLTIAVDDFGTGYSSLAYLVDIPFDEVKLDRVLVMGLDTDPVRRALVRHCVGFCHDLGLVVVAEGVEQQAEQDELVRLGVDRLQGFHLHRPCPASELSGPAATP